MGFNKILSDNRSILRKLMDSLEIKVHERIHLTH